MQRITILALLCALVAKAHARVIVTKYKADTFDSKSVPNTIAVVRFELRKGTGIAPSLLGYVGAPVCRNVTKAGLAVYNNGAYKAVLWLFPSSLEENGTSLNPPRNSPSPTPPPTTWKFNVSDTAIIPWGNVKNVTTLETAILGGTIFFEFHNTTNIFRGLVIVNTVVGK